MKVFISWSGNSSHHVALILRDWLPSVIQAIIPYVSSEDTEKGSRWPNEIAKELEETNFGILCITSSNLNAPWLNFEAGAISKSVDRSRVSPLLIGIKRSEITGPLLQFQSTVFDKEEIRKLLQSINNSCSASSLEVGRLNSIFEVWWPKLKDEIDPIVSDTQKEQDNSSSQENASDRHTNEIIEEVLETVRIQQRLLSDPTNLLPPSYLRSILRENGFNKPYRINPAFIRDLSRCWEDINSFLESYPDENMSVEVIRGKIKNLNRPIRYILGISESDQELMDIMLRPKE